jgi:Restriction endonuclease NotI
MAQRKRKAAKPMYRYGIGEWYGKVFTGLSAEERRRYAKMQFLPKRDEPAPPCPFRTTEDTRVPCSKAGGVCSIRRYMFDSAARSVTAASAEGGQLVTTCPHRFKEAGTVFRLVGERLLGAHEPLIVGEVPFLERRAFSGGAHGAAEKDRKVGRIDSVLVHPDLVPMNWCALEIQSVYFSGRGMRREFRAIGAKKSLGLPFPTTNRRPDFRSSGPKRLMPQLQTKVPTLRRWGKKMAVVVDKSFFDALGGMREVRDISSCDIAWFVVRFDVEEDKSVLGLDSVKYTTLEDAVEGLTGGEPVSREVFEERIRRKLAAGGAAS